jgi:hypothetical protein
MDRRQRPDGTWTYTTEEWDTQWYWPVGTRVQLVALGGALGTVTKQNNVTATVKTDRGDTYNRVPFAGLIRLTTHTFIPPEIQGPRTRLHICGTCNLPASHPVHTKGQ